ncbi:MAG: DNA repair and recombination protein RadA [Candidatus Aenigmarchaeota archaeon]|nr:DNA repair and recombination protein RadA [Candidatus Aenigmarchaeota archaeon]
MGVIYLGLINGLHLPIYSKKAQRAVIEGREVKGREIYSTRVSLESLRRIKMIPVLRGSFVRRVSPERFVSTQNFNPLEILNNVVLDYGTIDFKKHIPELTFYRVKKIEKIKSNNRYVYDFSTENESFVVNGVFAHNTESTFRPERIVQMAKALNLDPQKVLKNIYVARAFNSDHQLFLIEKARDMIKEKNIKLIIIDSLMSHFRADYVGRGELATRQQKVNRMMHELQRLADAFNLAIYVTNQVMARPDVLFGDPTAPIGGHVVAHQATYRVYLRKSKDNKRIARLRDSPDLPPGECVFRITEEGIRDV